MLCLQDCLRFDRVSYGGGRRLIHEGIRRSRGFAFGAEKEKEEKEEARVSSCRFCSSHKGYGRFHLF